MKASAVANANIALVKYWGKRNKKLMLPQNSSISVTLDGVFVHTTVDFDEKYKKDIFILNGKKYDKGSEEYDEYIETFLNFVRKFARTNLKAKIVSKNNFPSSAGLASSAAGFAALSEAINKALKLDLSRRDLSILARHGSGSATRSIFGGFVEWQKGEEKDGSDSFAKGIASPDYWKEFKIMICLTSKKEKKIKSRTGMEQTIKTSPYYQIWLKTIEGDLRNVKKGIREKKINLVGETSEENCLKMHATMITTKPPIFYWNSGTMEIIHSVLNLREEGVEAYFTIDAGSQVKIICLESDVRKIKERVSGLKGTKEVIITGPGKGSFVTNKHLF
ncbi:MAG: diphosphomevalonate decarboxylase [Patescibacteria group bacterium]